MRRSVPGPLALRRRFAASETGIATLEFAVLVPLLLALVYGVAEYVNASDHRNKVSALARTLADLTSQNVTKQILPATMTDNLRSAAPVLAPFNATLATIQISSIGVNAGNATFVCSTWPKTGGIRTKGKSTTIDVPTNFQRAGARFVLAEVRMDYQPLFGRALSHLMSSAKFNFKWSETVAWPVRGGESLKSGQDAEVVMPEGTACDPSLT
ncbi:Flp pilus assembly protein TadG [Methylorubrum rhodinum]|uniref:Flp pilus assembly protein TadG n=1 Tax=Methylorubrum rhodinum TaxID=29428 RepID=A0A840ZEZ5_9HYPH|nr:TadE/TadG family type IV pilus assembly protein [Methylorubrum rhodinum]MBB5755577.1 Flp pilus assembly protein TadG [Methylorubrum rhodinum]